VASNGKGSPSSGFLNYIRPQLPASLDWLSITVLLITSRYRQHRKHHSCCCFQLPMCKHACLWSCYMVMAVVQLLISRSLPSNGFTCHIPLYLRLFILNSLQVYHYFLFSKGCACDVYDRSQLPSCGSFLKVITIQLLLLLVLSSFLVRCELV
jgi:hypothetical protein